MSVQEITTKEEWNKEMEQNAPVSGAFLQSWEWGEFQKALGHAVRRVHAGSFCTQAVRMHLPLFGGYWFCPRGPLGKGNTSEIHALSVALPGLFLRMEPSSSLQGKNILVSNEHHPAHTRITDLTALEEALLAEMHHKTRYNIRLATRKEVEVRLHEPGTVLSDEMWDVLAQTAKRGGFRLHSRAHYEAMLSTLSSGDVQVFLATAWHEQDLLAINIMVDDVRMGVRTYLHGASSNTKRNLMAPYLLHWELMRAAKSAKLRAYDWWGVAPEGADASHAWAGISRFKRGFPGKEYAFGGTIDLIQRPIRYKVYAIVRFLNRFLRSVRIRA